MNLKNFLMNDEAVYSITRPYEAKQVVKFIKSIIDLKYPSIIIDATAGVGGDTINFSFEFDKVVSFEINRDTYCLLNTNIEIFKRKNINTHNSDFVDSITNLSFKLRLHDTTFTNVIIYIDAPWNGSSYKDKKDLILYLSNISLQDLVSKVYQYFDSLDVLNKINLFVFLKVPLNISTEGFNINKAQIIYNKKGAESFQVIQVVE